MSSDGSRPVPPQSRSRPSQVPRHRLSITLVVAAIAVGLAIVGNVRGSETPTTTAATGGTPLDLTQPFAGTPAFDWPDGANGITLPVATPVGPHSAPQVAAATTVVKKALIAAHLDNRMLINHDPSAYLALLAPNARDREQAALSGAAIAGDGGEATMIATGFTLLPIPVKVDGAMTVDTDLDGALVVHANYVFAFPFAPAESASITQSGQIVAVQHVREDFTVVTSADYAPADQGLWPTRSQSYYESMACGPSRQGFLAPAYSQPYVGPAQTAGPESFFDPDHPITITATCP